MYKKRISKEPRGLQKGFSIGVNLRETVMTKLIVEGTPSRRVKLGSPTNSRRRVFPLKNPLIPFSPYPPKKSYHRIRLEDSGMTAKKKVLYIS